MGRFVKNSVFSNQRKWQILLVLVLGSSISATDCYSQAKSGTNPTGQHTNVQEEKIPEFDSALAEKLGADEYGMKTFVFVTLLTGKKKIEDPKENQKIFAGHFANMKRLAREGKLALAGPFIEGTPKRGLFILNVDTIKEAEKIVKTDPAVKAGVFDFELTKLYCSAALLKVNEMHQSIQKKPVN